LNQREDPKTPIEAAALATERLQLNSEWSRLRRAIDRAPAQPREPRRPTTPTVQQPLFAEPVPSLSREDWLRRLEAETRARLNERQDQARGHAIEVLS
jgi:hypothetical protein